MTPSRLLTALLLVSSGCSVSERETVRGASQVTVGYRQVCHWRAGEERAACVGDDGTVSVTHSAGTAAMSSGRYGECICTVSGQLACGHVCAERGASADAPRCSLTPVATPRSCVDVVVGDDLACALLDDGAPFCTPTGPPFLAAPSDGMDVTVSYVSTQMLLSYAHTETGACDVQVSTTRSSTGSSTRCQRDWRWQRVAPCVRGPAQKPRVGSRASHRPAMARSFGTGCRARPAVFHASRYDGFPRGSLPSSWG